MEYEGYGRADFVIVCGCSSASSSRKLIRMRKLCTDLILRSVPVLLGHMECVMSAGLSWLSAFTGGLSVYQGTMLTRLPELAPTF
jgi:hypothetical protein